jgi:hypothetical protein
MSRIDLRRARRSLAIAGSIAVLGAQALTGSASAAPSIVVKVSGTQLFCPFDTPAAGGSLFAITRDRSDGGSFAFVNLDIEPNDPAAPVLSGGMDDPPLLPTGYHDSFDVAIDETGEIVGSATVDATFTGTGAYRARRIYQDSVQMGIFEDLLVSGRLTVTTSAGNYQFDLSGCQADTQDRLDQAHHPSGPKPGGTAPANDTPTGAMPLAAGSQVQEWTGGAAIDAEAACVMGTGDDAFDFGIGRTVWFSVPGNGGSITVDPGGSDFDTVVAAYAVHGNTLDQVGCVDDDRAGQAQGSVTFDSLTGTTYLIQVGGVIGQFDGDPEDPQWGRLRLHVE